MCGPPEARGPAGKVLRRPGALEFGKVLPMLAEAAPAPFDGDDWLFEVKWDGYRALAFLERGAGVGRGGDADGGRTRLQSRRLRDLTPGYPDLRRLHRHLEGRQAVVDGEIVALREGRPDFQTLQKGGGPVIYIAFDILELDGEVLIGRPLAQRRRVLEHRLTPGPDLVVSRAVLGRGTDFYRAVVQSGLEGVVAKRLDSPYRPGRRSRDWLKVRNVRRLFAVVCGYTPAADARPFGSLVLGLPDRRGRLVYAGLVGTGLDQREMASLLGLLDRTGPCPFPDGEPRSLRGRAVWVEPVHVVEVECLELTDDGRLRHPVYRGLRPDKDVADCRAPAEGHGEAG
jgi:DNA ligase D-like protein (predicted ligase)